MTPARSWIEVSGGALAHNVGVFREIAGSRALAVVVKANAYGHGMVPVARAALAAGADWLAVFGVEEAFALRDAGVGAPILVLGPTGPAAWTRAAEEEIRLTAASVELLGEMARSGLPLRVHLKLETGTHRQGLMSQALAAVPDAAGAGPLTIEGAYTHFADIEDTTDHTFAMRQLEAFGQAVESLRGAGIDPPLLHTACTAAALLFPETAFGMLRVGIGAYGLWPSKETRVSRHGPGAPELRPVMTWKTRLSEVKDVPVGVTVGYGRTYKTTRPTRLGVLPVGYANGYDRGLSNRAHVLVRGRRAKVVGRVMMNMTVVELTDVPDCRVGDEVVLLGRQGDEIIRAETMADWLDTIHYEVVTRAEPGGERRLVE